MKTLNIFTARKNSVRDLAKLDMLKAFPMLGGNNPFTGSGNLISKCRPTICLLGSVLRELAESGFVSAHPSKVGFYKLECYISTNPQ